MKTWVLIAALVGLAVLLLAPLPYFFVDKLPSASNSSSDWGNFGSYFGGVVSPILTFIGMLLLIITIVLQHIEILDSKKEAIKQDMLRYLNKLDDDIDRLLSCKIMLDGDNHFTELGHMVYGIQEVKYWSRHSFIAALERLANLAAHYSESIAMYRDNVNSHFVYQAHRDKAIELLGFLDKQIDLLGEPSKMAITFSRKHLERI